MAKFVVAFRERDIAETISGMLKESGYEVLRICVSSDEVKRAFRTMQDGILISGFRLKDRRLDQFADDLSEEIQILCVSDIRNLQQLETKRIFRLALPLSRTSLSAWADMMSQLHYQRVPQRPDEDKQLIESAKKKIMAEMNLSEAQAHKHIQKLSMKLGLRMVQVAEQILNNRNI